MTLVCSQDQGLLVFPVAGQEDMVVPNADLWQSAESQVQLTWVGSMSFETLLASWIIY